MTAWIIDDGPLEWLARSVDPKTVSSWPEDQFFIAEATAQNASGRRTDLLAHQRAIQTFRVMCGTDAFGILYEHLRQPVESSANLAENQAIAWALAERDDAVLVTVDKRAAVLALAELGRSRVAHAFDLWMQLRDECNISTEEYDELCDATLRADQSLKVLPIRCR